MALNYTLAFSKFLSCLGFALLWGCGMDQRGGVGRTGIEGIAILAL
jgi:hypothetical protein